MSSVWGNHIQLSLFGESHGKAIGVIMNGLPAGFEINFEQVKREMARRAPGRNETSTDRKEGDEPEVVSGYFNNKTTGTPLCAMIRNDDTRSEDYNQLKDLMRPGHADYTGAVKYNGFNDYRGGGHFSGRLTAPLVFAGAVCKQILATRGIFIGAHIKSINGIEDTSFDSVHLSKEILENLYKKELPVIELIKEAEMKHAILTAKNNGDSIGGVVECAIIGAEAGVGNPFFDSVESTLAHLIFSIPAVKGIEFGTGFQLSQLLGSQTNDAWYYDQDHVKTKTNHNGGILGGITTGMPIIFSCAIKPTPSIAKMQQTINLAKQKNDVLAITGRHDPCIVPRALPVIEAVAAIGIFDLLQGAK